MNIIAKEASHVGMSNSLFEDSIGPTSDINTLFEICSGVVCFQSEAARAVKL